MLSAFGFGSFMFLFSIMDNGRGFRNFQELNSLDKTQNNVQEAKPHPAQNNKFFGIVERKIG